MTTRSTTLSPARRTFQDYLQLTKPRIVLLLLFTTLTAMVVAAQGHNLPLQTVLATAVGGWLAASGSGVLNQYLDRDIDGRMSRTKNRPIPAGRVSPERALLFGLALLALSLVVLGWGANRLTAVLAFIGMVYYIFVYTILLKRRGALNIVIGGGAGAMPVLVGWAAATNGLSAGAFILFAIIFLWTPPHSWALAVLVNADYKRADVPMLPVAHGEETTRIQIVLYSLQLVILTLLPLPFQVLGYFYFVAAALLGAALLGRALRLLRQATKPAARQMYKYSSAYLALLFLCMMVDQLLFRG
ncbi:MAG: heme o synthase [Anaerolineales bacterium]|nr:heme o synthase [Anaerolineales bacterium]